MLFIAFIIFTIAAVLFLKIISSVKAGRVLPKYQNNLACSYLNGGKAIGFTLYNAFTYILMATFAYRCLNQEIPALVPLAGFAFFTVAYFRATKVLRETKFVAVDEAGTVSIHGKFLKPATVEESELAAKQVAAAKQVTA